VVICLEQGADMYMAQPMPLPHTVSCFSKIQIGFTFLVPAHPGSSGTRATNQQCQSIEGVALLLLMLQTYCNSSDSFISPAQQYTYCKLYINRIHFYCYFQYERYKKLLQSQMSIIPVIYRSHLKAGYCTHKHLSSQVYFSKSKSAMSASSYLPVIILFKFFLGSISN